MAEQHDIALPTPGCSSPPLAGAVSQSAALNLLPSFLVHHPPWRLLLCSEHGCFLAEKQAIGHLKQFHHGLHLTQTVTSREIFRAIQQLHLIAGNADWTQLSDPIQPIPELGQPFPGYMCTVPECKYRSKSDKNAGRHLVHQHGWQGRENRYRPNQPKPLVVRPMQFLFSRSHPDPNGYILVIYRAPLYQFNPTTKGAREQNIWPAYGRESLLLRQPATLRPSTPPIPTVQAMSPPSTAPNTRLPLPIDPWMRRTGWHELFPAPKRDWIRGSSQLAGQVPGELVGTGLSDGKADVTPTIPGQQPASAPRTEEILERVEAEVAALIHEASDHIGSTSWQARAKLVCFVRTVRYTRPFNALRTQGGRRRYTRIWQRLLDYVIRISRCNEQVQQEHWGLILPEQVQTAADTVYLHARTLDRLGKKARQARARVPDATSTVEYSYHASELNAAVMNLSLALIAPEQRLRRAKQYPIIHFASALGLTQTGTFERARDYTGYLAGLIWVSRALCLFSWLPACPEPNIPEQRETRSEREALVGIGDDIGDSEDEDEGKEEVADILDAQDFLNEAEEDTYSGDRGDRNLYSPSSHRSDDSESEGLSDPSWQKRTRVIPSNSRFRRPQEDTT